MKAKTKLKELFLAKPSFQENLIVSGFTAGRITLIDDLTEDEAAQLLQIYADKPQRDAAVQLAEDIVKKKWKSNVISKAEKVGIKDPGSFDAFNLWMVTYSKYRKHLNAHNLGELKVLYRQLCALEISDKKSSKNHFTRAWWEKQERIKNLN